MRRPAGRSYLQRKEGGHLRQHSAVAHNAARARQDSPEGSGGEGHGAPDVHRVAQDVERETLDAVAHEDPKVVPEERACDAEGPGGRDDERLAEHEEHGGDERVEGLGEDLLARLLQQSAVVAANGASAHGRGEAGDGESGHSQGVADHASGEDAEREEVAAVPRVPAKHARYRLVPVLCA